MSTVGTIPWYSRALSILGLTEPDGDVILQTPDGVEMAVWDDLRFPAASINPAGSVAPPSTDSTEEGYPGTSLFSGSADNVLVVAVQLPHTWKPETALSPHIHWSNPVGTASAVTWSLYWRRLGNPTQTPGPWSSEIIGTVVAGSPAVSDQQCITQFGDISTTGDKESVMYLFRLYRRGNTDASTGTARLLEFDIHYQKNKTGTYLEYPGL